MQFRQTEQAPRALGPYSQAVRTGNLLFVSGQIALNPAGEFLADSVAAETKQVLRNLQKILATENLTLANVVKTTVFLTDIADFAQVNEVYAEFFGEHKPARACVAVQALPKGARVEIEAVAECRCSP